MVKKYKARIVSINSLIEDIYTLEFESLSGSFRYHPGQFLHLALDSAYDGSGQWPDSRCFSMQSNPSESSLRISYSPKGSFTRKMAQTLSLGSVVWLKLPYGDLFTQDHTKERTVFIAGGTGITPFLSLFSDSSFAEYKNARIYLGFRSRNYNIYQNELEQIASYHSAENQPVISYFYQDENGAVNIDQILKENSFDTSYFISGPPNMIKNFKIYLNGNGIKSDQIKTDDWE